MANWFSSDHHFGHENIIRFCKRPFKSVGAMNFEMTRRWKYIVAPRDTVYYPGDFAMGDVEACPKFCGRLHGTKNLVRGNHEKGYERMLAVGFAEVLENVVVEIDGTRVWMNHYPTDNSVDHRGYVRPNAPGPYDIAVCGHIHQKWKVKDRCVNVGVDVWDFKPISLADVRAALVTSTD